MSAPDGNEEICCLYFCLRCEQYYLDCYHAKFTVGDSFAYQREVTAEEAETVQAAISGCRELTNRYCGCEYHGNMGRILFGAAERK